MRWDYSIRHRAEDRWREMHQSAREQRLLKQVGQAGTPDGQSRDRRRFLGRVFDLARAAAGAIRRVEG